MSDTRWDVFLLGEPQPGVTRVALASKLGAVFKKESAAMEQFLVRPRNLLKKAVDEATALKYKAVIEQAGGICELEHHVEKPLPASDAGQPVASDPAPSTPGPVVIPVPAEKLPSRRDSWMPLLALAFGGFIVLLGILAAIAIPAYQDYLQRANSAAVPPLIAETQNQVAAYGEAAMDQPPAGNGPVLAQNLFSEDRRLSVSLPQTWQTRTNLSDFDSIGAADPQDETYLIVIEEPLAEFDGDISLHDYTRVVVSLMGDLLQEPQVHSKLRRYKINGLPAEELVLSGRIDGLDITYLLTTVESDRAFYQILSWTLSSKFQSRESLFRDITGSFVVRTHPAY